MAGQVIRFRTDGAGAIVNAPVSSRGSVRETAVISANSAWNLLNFRRPIIEALVTGGWKVVALVPADHLLPKLETLGVEVQPLPIDARGVSPVGDAMLLLRYKRLFRQIAPAVFLGFTAKPNIYGSIAAASEGIPAINTITGLGTGFLTGRALEALMSTLYRIALRKSHRIFFHNSEDRGLFVERGMARHDQTAVVGGSGVNVNDFAPRPPFSSNPNPVFLFIGRFLKDKGVEEFISAAEAVKSRTEAVFRMVGAVEDHPKAVSRHRIQQAVAAGTIEVTGQTADVRPFIAEADCVVLPSYREGRARVLLEAAAMAKPVISTDVAGCRDVVDHLATGLLCPARSAHSLADVMFAFTQMPCEERQAMGRRARIKAELEFSEDDVVRAYLDALGSLAKRGAVPGKLQASV